MEKIENIVFPKVIVHEITDMVEEAKKIDEWIEKHPEEAKQNLESYDYEIEKIELWKKLMNENPDGVANYLNSLDNQIKYIMSVIQKNDETNKKSDLGTYSQ